MYSKVQYNTIQVVWPSGAAEGRLQAGSDQGKVDGGWEGGQDGPRLPRLALWGDTVVQY